MNIMTDPKNIPGEFTLKIAGQERTIKCSFGVIEELETRSLGRPVGEVLMDYLNSKFSPSTTAIIIHAGLKGAKDTRMTKAQVGDALLEQGMADAHAIAMQFMTYACTGGKPIKEGGETGEE